MKGYQSRYNKHSLNIKTPWSEPLILEQLLYFSCFLLQQEGSKSLPGNL